MKNTKIYSIFFAGAFLLLAAAILPESASAQGRYVNTYSKRDVSNIVTTLEQTSNRFRSDFDTAMDHSTWNGTSAEDRANRLVGSYEESLDRLRSNYDRYNSWWENRSNVQEVINRARPVNDMMVTLPFYRTLERQWANMRRDINKLADTFDLPGIAGGGWNGGGGGGNPGGGGYPGGSTSTPPSWAVGTFYSTDGSNIQLTIGPEGRITVINGGQQFYGRYNRGMIWLNNDSSTVTRIGNGIRTYNRNQGVTTDYSRNGWGGGTGPGIGGGNASTPPSWAQGTFYSPGRDIVLTIARNGRVTVFTGGQSYYGTYYNNQITLNNDTSTVTRNGNGIRTYNQNTNQTTNYRRQ